MATSEEFTITIRASDDGVISLIDNPERSSGKSIQSSKDDRVFKRSLATSLKSKSQKVWPRWRRRREDGPRSRRRRRMVEDSSAHRLPNQTLDIAGRAWSAAERQSECSRTSFSSRQHQDTAEAFGVSTEQVSR